MTSLLCRLSFLECSCGVVAARIDDVLEADRIGVLECLDLVRHVRGVEAPFVRPDLVRLVVAQSHAQADTQNVKGLLLRMVVLVRSLTRFEKDLGDFLLLTPQHRPAGGRVAPRHHVIGVVVPRHFAHLWVTSISACTSCHEQRIVSWPPDRALRTFAKRWPWSARPRRPPDRAGREDRSSCLP